MKRQVARIDGEVVEAPLKTRNSYRTLSIGADAIEILREQRSKVAGEYVFPSPNGGPISPDSVLHMLHRLLDRDGLPPLRFHDLRHPYVKPKTKKYEIFFGERHTHAPQISGRLLLRSGLASA